MNKNAAMIWAFAAGWVLTFSLLTLLIALWANPFDVWPFLVLVASAVAGLVTFVTRENAQQWARFLSVLVLGLVSGICVFLVLLLVGAVQQLGIPWTGASVAIGCGVMLIFFVLTHRRLAVAAVGAAVVILATLIIFSVHSRQYTKMMNEYQEKWTAKGWPTEVDEIFPSASTHDICEPWITICERTRSDELKDYYHSIGRFSADIGEALESGDDLGPVFLESPLVTDDQWQVLKQLNRDAIAAAEQCPSLQWFDPVDFADKVSEIPIPNLLGLMYWLRGMVVEATHLAASGQPEEAGELCFSVIDGARALQTRSPLLIKH